MQCWLGELGLSEHKDNLMKAGFANLRSCARLKSESLERAGIVLPPGHKLRLLSAGSVALHFIIISVINC